MPDLNLIYSNPRFQAWGKDGYFLAYGRLTIYDAGTEDKKDIFDKDDNPLDNPLTLDAQGKVTENGIRTGTGNYKLVWEKRLDNGSYYEVDTVDDILNTDATPSTDSSSIVDTMVDLRSLPVPTEQTSIILSRYYSDSKQHSALYFWDENSNLNDNNGTVIQPGALPAIGRWIMSPNTNIITPYHFGMIPDDDEFDNQTRLTQMLTWARTNTYVTVVITEGVWYTSGNITFECNVRFDVGASFNIATVPALPYFVTFADSAVFDIPYKTTIIEGAGLKYLLVVADNAINKNDYVSLLWGVPSGLGDAGTAVNSFFLNINNTFGGVVINDSFNVQGAAFTISALETGFILQEGAELIIEGTLQIPRFIIDERNDKSAGVISMGDSYHSTQKRELPISAFKSDSDTASALMSDSTDITATLRIILNADWEYDGLSTLITNKSVTLVPNTGIITNVGPFNLTVSGPVDDVKSRWLNPSSSDFITVTDQDIKVSWFVNDNFEDVVTYALDWGQYVDLEGSTWVISDSKTLTNNTVKFKNGIIRCESACSILFFSQCSTFALDGAAISMDNAAGNIQIGARTGLTNNLYINDSDLSGTFRFKYTALAQIVGDFQVKDSQFNEFQYFAGINPTDATNVYNFYDRSKKRFIRGSQLNSIFYSETLVWFEINANRFSDDEHVFETPRSINVYDNENEGDDFKLYGGLLNTAWYLNGVSFRNNKWMQATGNITYENIERYSNAYNSVFEGNVCETNPDYGILNNRRLFFEDVVQDCVGDGANLRWDTDGTITGNVIRYLDSNPGNKYYMDLGRHAQIWDDGNDAPQALQKQVTSSNRTAIRASSDSGVTWTDWASSALANSVVYYAVGTTFTFSSLSLLIPQNNNLSDIDGNGDYKLLYSLSSSGDASAVTTDPTTAIQCKTRVGWLAEV